MTVARRPSSCEYRLGLGVSAPTLVMHSQPGKLALPVWLVVRRNLWSYGAKVDCKCCR